MQAGNRVACAMPIDMLSLQTQAAGAIASSERGGSDPHGMDGAGMSMDAIMALMNQQAQRQ
jgi:hypothetical protein